MSYNDFPPVNTLKTVLYSYPQSALLLIELWKKLNKKSQLSVRRNEVKRKFLISPTLFRNHLLALTRLDILVFQETPDFYLIELPKRVYDQ